MTDDEWIVTLTAERFAAVLAYLENEHGLEPLPTSAVEVCVAHLAGVLCPA